MLPITKELVFDTGKQYKQNDDLALKLFSYKNLEMLSKDYGSRHYFIYWLLVLPLCIS